MTFWMSIANPGMDCDYAFLGGNRFPFVVSCRLFYIRPTSLVNQNTVILRVLCSELHDKGKFTAKGKLIRSSRFTRM